MPPGANLSKDFYQSKKLLEGLDMSYVKIDVCKNNSMLYYKDNEHKEKCDICGTSRYEEGQNKVPRKVLRYLPIKDRLQRLYAEKYGPERATTLNTYAAMKYGLKNWDGSGRTSTTLSRKAKKLFEHSFLSSFH